MGVIKNILRGGVRNYSLRDFDQDFYRHYYGGWKSTTGVTVNEETALKFTAVFACIRIISEDIGMLPIEIRKWRNPKDKSKGSDLAYELPLFDLMTYSPNPEQNSMVFDETLQSHILTSGNGYAYKHMDGRGRVNKIQLLDWYDVKPERNKDTGAVEYIFNDRNKPITLPFDEVFHIPGLSYDGLVGYSPVKVAMEAIGLGLAAEQFAAYFYANGANVGGFIELPGKVKDKDAMRKEFEGKFAGLGKAHKILFLEEGMKFQKLVMPLQEAQFIETRKFQLEEIARIYRMPMHMIQDLSHATFSNVEHQDLAYSKRTLFPWIKRWELSIDTRLLTKKDRQAGYFSQFNIDEALRSDSKTRADVMHIKRQDGIMSANEWRAADGMNPRLEPEADLLVINGNMREISIVKSTDAATGGEGNAKKEILDV
ncbi:MAG: phage portal protein [Eubacteriales bacterium]